MPTFTWDPVSSTSAESDGSSNGPSIKVKGEVTSSFVLNIAVTGGTATAGSDFNLASTSLTIPAGSYDGISAASTFAVPLTVNSDTDYNEADETVILTLTGPGPSIVTLSGFNCTTGSVTSTHTITDVTTTAVLTVVKSWESAKVSDAVTITTSGATNNVNFAAIANTATNTYNVYAGETLIFAENYSTGTSADYSTTLACTGATDTDATDGLLIDAADTAIICTYTNTHLSADLSVTKTLDTAGPYISEQNVNYSILVSNAGPNAATNVVVTDLPTNLTVTNAFGPSSSCTITPATGVTTSVVCTIASLAALADVTITIQAKVP